MDETEERVIEGGRGEYVVTERASMVDGRAGEFVVAGRVPYAGLGIRLFNKERDRVGEVESRDDGTFSMKMKKKVAGESLVLVFVTGDDEGSMRVHAFVVPVSGCGVWLTIERNLQADSSIA